MARKYLSSKAGQALVPARRTIRLDVPMHSKPVHQVEKSKISKKYEAHRQRKPRPLEARLQDAISSYRGSLMKQTTLALNDVYGDLLQQAIVASQASIQEHAEADAGLKARLNSQQTRIHKLLRPLSGEHCLSMRATLTDAIHPYSRADGHVQELHSGITVGESLDGFKQLLRSTESALSALIQEYSTVCTGIDSAVDELVYSETGTGAIGPVRQREQTVAEALAKVEEMAKDSVEKMENGENLMNMKESAIKRALVTSLGSIDS